MLGCGNMYKRICYWNLCVETNLYLAIEFSNIFMFLIFRFAYYDWYFSLASNTRHKIKLVTCLNSEFFNNKIRGKS